MRLRKGFILNEDGTLTAPLENIWDRARCWAKRNNKEYVSTYGVVDVAPI